MPETKEKETFDQANLINVSTQNNFCGYYVLARRIIFDDNFSSELIDSFNQFYCISWNKKQLAMVLNNMHPEQAEVMLGLVLHHQYALKKANAGLEPYELNELCQSFAYNLFIYQRDSDRWPISDQFSFTSFQEYSQNTKKIFVLFQPSSRQMSGEFPLAEHSSELGHYYLCEPDKMKVVADARLRTKYDDHKYAINNVGRNTEIFINNIKESAVKIDQQLDEYYAWRLAVKEADRITSKEHSLKEQLSNFNCSFFSGNSVKLTKQQTEVQEKVKSYVRNLQHEEIEYWRNKLKSQNSQLDLNETTNTKKGPAVSRR